MQVHPVAVMLMSDPSPRQSDSSQCKAGVLPSGAGYSATLRRTELEAAGRGHPCYGPALSLALHGAEMGCCRISLRPKSQTDRDERW